MCQRRMVIISITRATKPENSIRCIAVREARLMQWKKCYWITMQLQKAGIFAGSARSASALMEQSSRIPLTLMVQKFASCLSRIS